MAYSRLERTSTIRITHFPTKLSNYGRILREKSTLNGSIETIRRTCYREWLSRSSHMYFISEACWLLEDSSLVRRVKPDRLNILKSRKSLVLSQRHLKIGSSSWIHSTYCDRNSFDDKKTTLNSRVVIVWWVFHCLLTSKLDNVTRFLSKNPRKRAFGVNCRTKFLNSFIG